MKGMFDCHLADDQIKIGDGTFTKAVKIGSKNVLVKQSPMSRKFLAYVSTFSA
jgi:hypothetical protein